MSNFIYNYFLGEQKWLSEWLKYYGCSTKEDLKAFMKENPSLYFNAYDASKYVTRLKTKKEFEFLKKGDATITTTSLDNLSRAFDNMKKTGSGFPQFKSNHLHKSYRCRITSQRKVDIKVRNKKWGKFKLHLARGVNVNPKVIINITSYPDFAHRIKNETGFKINSYTVSIDAYNNFYISFQVEEEVAPIKKSDLKDGKIVGVDMGVVRPATTSQDADFLIQEMSSRIEFIKKNRKKKVEIERSLAKKRLANKDYKKSKKYNRLKSDLSKINVKIKNQRRHVQHAISRMIADMDIDIIALEKLNIKGMMKRSAKGKSNQKRHLSRSLSDVGIFEIQRQLVYKANWVGKRVIKVGSKYTSQTCNECGHINKKNRKNQSTFICQSCGHETNADLNAAKNIRDRAKKKIEEKMDESIFE